MLTMPAETLDSLLYQLENNNVEDVLNILKDIKVAAEQIQYMGEDAAVKVKKIINVEKDKEHFGNGRYINHLFDNIIMNHALNCKDINDSEILKTISIDDLNNIDGKEKIIGFRV